MRLCVQKNKIDIITIGAIIKILSHLAPDKLPINQKAIDCIPSLLLAKYTIKLEKALHTALNAIPANNNFIELAFPPRLAINTTPNEIVNAPIKADIPTKFSPKATPIPSKIAAVAPKEAPEEIPKIYGPLRQSIRRDSPAPGTTARIHV